MMVQKKNDEALREKVGTALAYRLARLGGATTVPPDMRTLSLSNPHSFTNITFMNTTRGISMEPPLLTAS